MSIQEYYQAKQLMQQYQHWMDFVGPRTPDLIRLAETTLGLHFPETYRQFLLDYGAGGFGSAEFSGVIDDNFVSPDPLNAIQETLLCRREYNLPESLIIIKRGIVDEDYFIMVGKEGEDPIVEYVVGKGIPPQIPKFVAPDFGSFFLRTIKEQIQRGTSI